jgi:hypothetical protein
MLICTSTLYNPGVHPLVCLRCHLCKSIVTEMICLAFLFILFICRISFKDLMLGMCVASL